ncbi:serine-rich adhesin for platelets isoform X2 [Anthonomus grandis grandis]|uniref:serine-rich adhesin for platelets isoform X2 n=1 Tax=Anthonomus grandis grandis TaxID=2921223 RepID=UPI002166539B|nr:serine-rich adhesin for platelets isoform X2 [Anthonomus grandis grandis]
MSVKSSGSHDGPMPSTGEIIRSGLLKKMKTNRKKYFVLRADTSDALARLEYYDSEKRFRSGANPKRSITLRTCFNINEKLESKHKNVIALYTKDDCFCIGYESKEELKLWLKDFLTLQHGKEITEGQPLKPKFEFVWQVSLCARGLGAGRTGFYRLCLTDTKITLYKIGEAFPTIIELLLTSVRSCGNLKNFFYLEVGRMSDLGAGEMWFEADDTNIALNIQTTVKHRFKRAREMFAQANLTASGEPMDFQSKEPHRIRSASATEPSKPLNKKYNPIFSSKHNPLPQESSSESTITPNSKASQSSGTSAANTGVGWSGVPNHQRTQSLPITAESADNNSMIDNHHSITNHLSGGTTSKKTLTAIINGGGKCTSFRERCDSMPSRPRTASEGNHGPPGWGKPYLVPLRTHHIRDNSHSPPTGSPMSPPSDSTGSLYSLGDEHDGFHDMEHHKMYNTLTPEEAIAEEDYPESPRADPPEGHYIPMNNFQGTPESNYTDMNHSIGNNYASNSASSMSSVTSGTPSTDLRLADYPLDKVFSYVLADDDDNRPCRAYSVGSKPPEPPLASTPENPRVRAFSVGAKTKKYFNRVINQHHNPSGVKSNSAPLLAANSRSGSSHGSVYNPMDDLLEIDFSCNAATRSRSSTNASSSSDSRASTNRNSNGTRGKFFGLLEHFGFGNDQKKPSRNGYVDMKPGINSSIRSIGNNSPYVDMTQRQRQANHFMDMSPTNPALQRLGNEESPYLDMSGRNGNREAHYLPTVGNPNVPYFLLSDNHDNVPTVGHPFSPYLDMSGKSGAKVGNGHEPYMDMSGPGRIGRSTVGNGHADYMDMSGSSPVRHSPRNTGLSNLDLIPTLNRNTENFHDAMQKYRTNSNSSTSSKAAISPGFWPSDPSTDYLDMSGRNSSCRRSERTSSFQSQMSSSPPFLKMSNNSNLLCEQKDLEGNLPIRHQRQSSTESADDYGDYLNMSGQSTRPTTTTSQQTTRSQPITIKSTSGGSGLPKSSSPMSITSLLMGRRFSPPTESSSTKMHLPLSPYSSLPRQKLSRKGSSQASSSKDSSLNSSVTTTPSSSSTMFPMSLNSPVSPQEADLAKNTETAASVKVPTSVLNTAYNTSVNGVQKKAVDDYTVMDCESASKTVPAEGSTIDSPYMNCTVGSASRPSRVPSPPGDNSSGDYAVIKPGVFQSNPATLPKIKESSSGLSSPLVNRLSGVRLTEANQSMCFMPIRENDERMYSPKPGDVPDKIPLNDKTLETANMEFEDESSRVLFERAKSTPTKNSRPNSSNSEKISKTQNQRPASTTGTEKAASRPSSECSEGLASRLGSNSSVYSSSSTSTIVGVTPSDNLDQSHQQVVLNYASLDLSTTEPWTGESSSSWEGRPRSPKSNLTEADTGSTTTFVYADIDFVRSDELNKGGQGADGATVKN